MLRAGCLIGLLGFLGCAHTGMPPMMGQGPRVAPFDTPKPFKFADDALRHQVIQRASAFVAGHPIRSGQYIFGSDPVGFVRAAFWSTGIQLIGDDTHLRNMEGLRAIYISAKQRGTLHHRLPSIGELVFFNAHTTTQANAVPVQVAIVETVSPKGKIIALGYFAHGPARVSFTHAPQQAAAGGILMGYADVY